MLTSDNLPYDPSSRTSIVAYAEQLLGHTLREVLDELPKNEAALVSKGDFGHVVERYYFHYELNNNPGPDFAEVGVELKTTPLKVVRGNKIVAKERLVLGMIDYMTLDTETWEESSFLRKNSALLIVFYLWEKDRHMLDHPIKVVRLWEFPEEDLKIIREDWEKISAKVRDGSAHELSGGDTLYLEACTKAANSAVQRKQPHSSLPAKPRAFALKASYMNAIIGESFSLQPVPREKDQEALGFEQLVAAKFEPYIGLTAEEIRNRLGIRKTSAKNFYALLTKGILGVDKHSKIAEFAKADLHVKTIRLQANGRPKEAISFKPFKYVDIVEQDWEDSDLHDTLSKRFFFVLFRLDSQRVAKLEGVRFWTMPQSDLNTAARDCFERSVECVRENKLEYLPKISDNNCCHVRPHGRNLQDTYPLPGGGEATKKSFWLNAGYIAEQLGLTEPSRG